MAGAAVAHRTRGRKNLTAAPNSIPPIPASGSSGRAGAQPRRSRARPSKNTTKIVDRQGHSLDEDSDRNSNNNNNDSIELLEPEDDGSEPSADVIFNGEYPAPSFQGPRVSLSSNASTENQEADTKDSDSVVVGGGFDVRKVEVSGEENGSNDEESPKLARRLRTRTQSGKQDRISYAKYFDEEEENSDASDDDDDDDKEEEEEESNESAVVADDCKTASKEIGEEEENMSGRGDSNSVINEEENGVQGGNDVYVKKRYGISFLMTRSEGGEKAGAGSEATSVSQSSGPAKRTRSHFDSAASEKLKKLGTLSNPLCLDEDDPEDKANSVLPSLDDIDSVDQCEKEEEVDSVDQCQKEEEIGSKVEAEGKERFEAGSISKKRKRVDDSRGTGKGADKVRPMTSKRKAARSRSLKEGEMFNILKDTIWNDDKVLPEEFTKEKSPVDAGIECQVEDWQKLLPPIFSFGDENPQPVEKLEHEKEMDSLWAEMDFALETTNVGTYHGDESQTDEVSGSEMEDDPFSSCSKGNHQFILDEQIGLRCKLCSFIKVHIRDIMPSWTPRYGARSAGKTTFNEDRTHIFNDLYSTVKGNAQRPFCPQRGTIWDLPGISKLMFPHQREAVEFAWRNLAGSVHLDELKSGVGSDGTGGCVISHAPGTGKTRTAIIFIQTYLKVFPKCRPVIFAPCVMLQGWIREFKKWEVGLSVYNMSDPEYSTVEDDAILKLVRKNTQDTKLIRMMKLHLWDKGNSVLLISYDLFTQIVSSDTDPKSAQLKKILLEKPGLIIFDEGHIPRNDKSAVFKALKGVRTSKRVILTGTPFQNNFKELYNILWLVRPKFAGSRKPKLWQGSRTDFSGGKEERSLWKRNEGKDKWAFLIKNITDNRSSTDIKTVEELKTIIEPFVHVYNGKILDNLPGSRECLIVLDPVPLVHKSTLEKMKGVKSKAGVEYDYRMSLASIHPYLVTSFSLSDEEKALVGVQSLENLRLNPDDGVKTKFVVELIRLSESLKEKVLVFCHHLLPLDMLMDQLVKLFNWMEGKEVVRMVGQDQLKHRQSTIDVFNDLSSEVRVMLASTKACSEGISLVGASRVVLLDVEWNPSVERQAISRAHRLGQTRFVYIYHLITYGTGESEKYSRQNKKDQWSKLVFSPEIDFNIIKASSLHGEEEEQTSKFVTDDKILEEMVGNKKLKDMFIKICYEPKESNIRHVFATDD